MQQQQQQQQQQQYPQQQQFQQQQQPDAFVQQQPPPHMLVPPPRLPLLTRTKNFLHAYFFTRNYIQIAAAFCLFVSSLVCLSRTSALFRKLHHGFDRCPIWYLLCCSRVCVCRVAAAATCDA